MSSSVGLRGIRTGTPVPLVNRERPVPNPVFTYQLSPEELARYRALPPPGAFVRRLEGVVRDNWPAHRPKHETEGREVDISLTKEQYLAERIGGKTRTQIAEEQGLKHLAYLYSPLQKWGIREKEAEEAAMTAMREQMATASAESTVEETDDDHFEQCDVCGKKLDKRKSEDFFVESKDGSTVLCEKHYCDELAADASTAIVPGQVPAVAEPGPAQPDVAGETSAPVAEVVQYVNVRIPVARVASEPPTSLNRGDLASLIQTGIACLRNAAAWVEEDLREYTGETDVTAKVQAYMERKVKELA